MRLKLLIFILVLPISLFSQKKLEGIIYDAQTNEKLVGASIYLVDFQKGTVSDNEGKFQLEGLRCSQAKIKFSFIGYETQLLNINFEKTQSLSIKLEPTVFESTEVFISGGSYSTQHQNAIKIESLGLSQLSESNASSLSEIISQVPGTDMLAAGGATKPVIRGLSMTNILLVNNGVKLENFQFSDHHPYLADEFGIDKVEVVKGPASILFGSDAVGGVINIIREKPETKGTSGDYNMKYNSNTQGIISNLGINSGNEKFYGGIRVGVKSYKDYLLPSGEFVPNTRFNEKTMKLYTGTNTDIGSFKLYFDYTKMEIGKIVEQSIALISENERTNRIWYQDLENIVLNSLNTIFIKDVKINANINWQMNHRSLIGVFENPITSRPVDMQLNTLAYDVKALFALREKNEMVLGFQGAYRTNRNGIVPQHVVPNADLSDFALLALLKTEWSDKLKTQAGIRHDFRKIQVPLQARSGDVNDLSSTNLLAEFSRMYSDLSFSIGGTYNFNEVLLIRTNLASAFRTPNIAELTQNGYHAERYEQGNLDLNSQRNYETDVSFHIHLNKVKMDISTFYNSINDYIFLSPTDTYNATNDEIYKYLQEDANIYGGEFAIDYEPYPFIELSANYAYLIGETKEGENLPFIPQNKINTSIKLINKNMNWNDEISLNIHAHYAFEQDKPSIYETSTDEYFLLDLSLQSKFKIKETSLYLGLAVENALNETYFDHLSILKEENYYNPGRSFNLNLKYSF